MDGKKKMVILVIIALVLAITAITINLTSPKDVSTGPINGQVNAGLGEIGITINPTEGIEDKLTEENLS